MHLIAFAPAVAFGRQRGEARNSNTRASSSSTLLSPRVWLCRPGEDTHGWRRRIGGPGMRKTSSNGRRCAASVIADGTAPRQQARSARWRQRCCARAALWAELGRCGRRRLAWASAWPRRSNRLRQQHMQCRRELQRVGRERWQRQAAAAEPQAAAATAAADAARRGRCC